MKRLRDWWFCGEEREADRNAGGIEMTTSKELRKAAEDARKATEVAWEIAEVAWKVAEVAWKVAMNEAEDSAKNAEADALVEG